MGVADLRGHLSSLSQSMPGEEEETQLDHEFKVTSCYKKCPASLTHVPILNYLAQLVMAVAPPAVESCSVALSEDNASKNRSTQDIPCKLTKYLVAC